MAPKISLSADPTKEKISYAASTDPINCYCGVLTVVRLSKTAANPNRPFHGCRNWNRQGQKGCGFFLWFYSVDFDRVVVPVENTFEPTVLLTELQLENARLRNENDGLKLRVQELEDRLGKTEARHKSDINAGGQSEESEDFDARISRVEKLLSMIYDEP
ncbi:hypothetical protein LINPERHAP1_LOCUS32156 [Linum perenne]